MGNNKNDNVTNIGSLTTSPIQGYHESFLLKPTAFEENLIFLENENLRDSLVFSLEVPYYLSETFTLTLFNQINNL